MLAIRLRRIGKRKDPSYRVVVSDSKFTPAGKFIADLGYYNPKTKDVSLEKEQVLAWLNKGAQPSNTTSKLLKKEKINHNSVVIKTRVRVAKTKAEDEQVKTPVAPVKAQETTEAESPITLGSETESAEPEQPSQENATETEPEASATEPVA